jgi:hypothetical protein
MANALSDKERALMDAYWRAQGLTGSLGLSTQLPTVLVGREPGA